MLKQNCFVYVSDASPKMPSQLGHIADLENTKTVRSLSRFQDICSRQCPGVSCLSFSGVLTTIHVISKFSGFRSFDIKQL